MLHLISTVAQRARINLHAQAVLFGAGLGWVAWELSRVGGASTFNLAMALMVVVSGSASFILFALHRQAAASRPTPVERFARIRMSLSLLGSGIALSIHGLAATLA